MESPQKEKFLEITRADAYTFTDCKGEKSYSCVNHNTFLKMMVELSAEKQGLRKMQDIVMSERCEKTEKH